MHFSYFLFREFKKTINFTKFSKFLPLLWRHNPNFGEIWSKIQKYGLKSPNLEKWFKTRENLPFSYFLYGKFNKTIHFTKKIKLFPSIVTSQSWFSANLVQYFKILKNASKNEKICTLVIFYTGNSMKQSISPHFQNLVLYCDVTILVLGKFCPKSPNLVYNTQLFKNVSNIEKLYIIIIIIIYTYIYIYTFPNVWWEKTYGKFVIKETFVKTQ